MVQIFWPFLLEARKGKETNERLRWTRITFIANVMSLYNKIKYHVAKEQSLWMMLSEFTRLFINFVFHLSTFFDNRMEHYIVTMYTCISYKNIYITLHVELICHACLLAVLCFSNYNQIIVLYVDQHMSFHATPSCQHPCDSLGTTQKGLMVLSLTLLFSASSST